MADVLSPLELAQLRSAAQERLGEVLRGLLVKHAAADSDDAEPARVRYAEVVERDGGRYDSRHGMASPPFTSLLRHGGVASKLIPALRRILGEDAEVVAVGQIVAFSPEGWDMIVDTYGDQVRSK